MNKSKIYFSDFFEVPAETIEKYGALNISLVCDMPLFIDPFLLFGSNKASYQKLHERIIEYLRFLRSFSQDNPNLDRDTRKALFCFPERCQTWLGFSQTDNMGAGLGDNFAKALYINLGNIFSEFGKEKITQRSHLEKLCIISDGVGRDCISDFTTNLIFDFLLEYTEKFAKKYIDNRFLRKISIQRSFFDFQLKRWCPKEFLLPFFEKDYVVLTPRDILTRENTWINKDDMIRDIERIAEAMPDGQLRSSLNIYLSDVMRDDYNKAEQKKAIFRFYKTNPELVDYFIKNKEDRKAEAQKNSSELVVQSEELFIENAQKLRVLLGTKGFYINEKDSTLAAMTRINFLRDIIENQDGYKLFYMHGKPIAKETDLQVMYRLTWFCSRFDTNREVNNGRGPVDFKLSDGNEDKTIVEFKLASNSKLQQNLKNQVEIYKKANHTQNAFKVILCFSDVEIRKTNRIIQDLGLSEQTGVYIIDASPNKVSASNVK